jgi:anti-anti-sigma factor
MAIQTKKEGNHAVMSVSGRLDAVTAPQFQKALREVVESGTTRVVVDFSELHYLSSAGVGELLVASNLAKDKGGRLLLANVPRNVVQVFEMCGIASLLQTHNSVADALAAIA